jgi:hypothetical protein
MARIAVFGILIGLMVLSASCAVHKPAAAAIRASNYREYLWWRTQAAGELPRDRWLDFNAAVDEVRLSVMAAGFTGGEAVDAELAARLNGRSVDDVLRLGDTEKIARLRAERDRLKPMIDTNALLGAVADTESSADLERRTSRQRERFAAILRDLDEAKAKCVAHGGHVAEEKPFDGAPAEIDRTEAVNEFDAIIESRLALANRQYGDWPARLESNPENLPPEVKTEYEDKKGLTAANGHVVIPVYLRARWWIFDAAVKYPDFSEAVTANLTASDRQHFEDAWAASEAEIWARRQAAHESSEVAVGRIQSELRAVVTPDGILPPRKLELRRL